MIWESATRVQILDKAVCISHSANNPGTDINPTILHPLQLWQTRFFKLDMVTKLGERKVWIQTSCTHLKI